MTQINKKRVVQRAKEYAALAYNGNVVIKGIIQKCLLDRASGPEALLEHVKKDPEEYADAFSGTPLGMYAALMAWGMQF